MPQCPVGRLLNCYCWGVTFRELPSNGTFHSRLWQNSALHNHRTSWHSKGSRKLSSATPEMRTGSPLCKKINIPDLTNHLIHKAIRGMVCSCFTKIGCPQTQRSDKNYCINISILGWSTPHNRANDIFSLCKKYCHFPILFYFSLCSRSFWKTKAWTPHHEFQILLSSSCSLDPSGGQKTVPR
jgi:hypothetical protein